MHVGGPVEGSGFFNQPPPVGRLKERFVVPPFSVWNTRDGDWQRRRRLWLAKGIQSEIGRDLSRNSIEADALYSTQYDIDVSSGRGFYTLATSVFDPVVCELVYSWWCPPGGVVVDPFAGGSVRGIVASVLGLKYYGIELRAEQVRANRAQINDATRGGYSPRWRVGDAYELLPLAPRCDFLFSCPPYGNLEVYSDEPGDLSALPHADFCRRYRDIIIRATSRLRRDSFACFVVGNYRAKEPGLQMVDFVGETVRAFAAGGAQLYNDVVLVNAVGTGALRVGASFVRGSRKVVKLHQNVLVFVKGDPARAAAKVPLSADVSVGGT